MLRLLPVLVLLSLCSFAFSADFYKEKPLFSKAPSPKQSVNNLTRVGPIGLSIDLIKPAFTMRIKSVETDSPADAAGLKAGQIIASINGETLKDIDPRIQLGNLITKAEATNGKLNMKVADKVGGPTKDVVVTLPALGAYSDTWPLDCPKSDKIVRNFAEYIKAGGNQGFGSLGMLFLLSTGDESDLAYVRDWARSRPTEYESKHFHTWNLGYGNIALCEYYLRTGDQEVLPAIQAAVDHALKAENNGAWGNRAAIAQLNYGGGGGHLNASSVPLAMFLILAKECGAEMPDEQFHRVLRHFYRWAGRGNISYGNNKPEGSYTDNGKNGKLAFMMAAAASLDPDGENTIYADARDVSALFSFCSTSFMLHGHTGGGIGEIWRSAAMGLLYEKYPQLYREFMDQRRWHYEMSRRHDGSFAILGGERYDNETWGAGYAWTYTVPRKTLQITGAPKSPHAKPYDLPERPWGTAEDDDFVTSDPIAFDDGTRPDFSKDTLREGGGIALLDVRKNKISDQELERYIRHPNIITRTYFIGNIAEQGPGYVLDLLNKEDARLRRLGLDTIVTRGGKKNLATPQIVDRAFEMIADPNESLFVKEAAIRLVALAPADKIVENIHAILPYLNHEDWWLQVSAMQAIAPVVVDERVYKKVLTALGETLRENHLYALSHPLYWGELGKNLRQASPEVAAFAREQLKDSYANYITYDHDMERVENTINPGMREMLAKALTKIPGGYDALYEVAKQQRPGRTLPYEELFLEAETSRFSPELKAAVNQAIQEKLIPRYIANSRDYLRRERANEAIDSSFYYRSPRVFGLVELYQRIGVDDYDWHDFGPKPTDMTWWYITFDPPEKMAWDINKPRYRKVTLPQGMQGWYKPSFNPAEHGWKQGKQPFGAINNKMVDSHGDCRYEFCRHGETVQTFWDQEVLLLNGKFKFPEFKQGHRYRLLVGGMSHVGAGEGFKIYVNGKEFFERERGVGRREGAKPISKHIDKTWWSDFSGKEVDLAAISFMGIHKGHKSRHLMIWVQEMKLPPLDDELLINSATIMPMESTAWQAMQDPDDNDKQPNAGKYLWDGNFDPNPEVVGPWRAIGVVASPDEFDPKARPNPRGLHLRELTLKPNGRTADPLWIYTGDTLMNLDGNEALKMQIKTYDGEQYLFVEQGGFHTKHGSDWRPTWAVMTPASVSASR